MIFFLVIGVGAYPGIRKKGYFEIFYWTHLLYLPCMLLFILHSDQAIWWFGIPCAIFLVGKVKMIKRRIDGSGKSYVVCGTLLPSKVRKQRAFSSQPNLIKIDVKSKPCLLFEYKSGRSIYYVSKELG